MVALMSNLLLDSLKLAFVLGLDLDDRYLERRVARSLLTLGAGTLRIIWYTHHKHDKRGTHIRKRTFPKEVTNTAYVLHE